MTAAPTAIAVLRTGERIPVSEPFDQALRLFRDGQYDMTEVQGIEQSGGAGDHAAIPDTNNRTATQLTLI